MRSTSLAVLVAALAACRQAPPSQQPTATAAAPEPPRPRAQQPNHVTLIFSGGVAGQLVPCGCSPDQRGGLPREVGLVDKLRQEDPDLLFIDAGDLLFENPSAPPKQLVTQRQLKARVLAQGDALVKAAARAVGQRDLALGPQFVTETTYGVPLLDAGVHPIPGVRATLLAEANGVKVGIFAAGFEENVPQVIAARAKGLRDEGARLVVLLLHPRGDNTWSAAQGLLPAAQAAGVDVVVLGRLADPATEPNRREPGPPALFSMEGEMQSLLRLDVQLGTGPVQLLPSAEDRAQEAKAIDVRIERFKAQIELYPERKQQLDAKIKELQDRKQALVAAPLPKAPEGTSWAQATFLPLTSKVPTAEQAQKLVDAYDQKVADLNLAEAKTQPESCPAAARGELAYVGVNECLECHQSEVEFWQQTRHAQAYETLVQVKKQFSLDCIRCHVTGWQQAGGVCRIDRTQFGGAGVDGHGVGRRDVQCEACHGPGSEHVNDPTGGHIRKEVTATMCMRCHEAANSPKFDYAKYKPFIVGPGHGMPLARGQKPQPRPGVPE